MKVLLKLSMLNKDVTVYLLIWHYKQMLLAERPDALDCYNQIAEA